MIELSPLDVRKKQDDFARSLRGYDVDQVDSFLEMVADRLEELVSENRRLSERVEALEEQLADYREREQALNEALLAAQELREEARSQAEKDAELRLEEAEAKAKEIIRQARERAENLRNQIDDLRQRKERFLHSMKGTLRRFSDELEVEEVRLGDDAETDRPAEARPEADPVDSDGDAEGEPHQVEIRSGDEDEPRGPAGEREADEGPGGREADSGDGASGSRDGAA